ncbi:MAG TPA: fibronectin type III domain-containing protein [Candidatus Acidoferrales bacterium]|nr:fibronectin type III domain-containing protein [Candidatus Acidoferrales bacterium]
MKKKTAPKKATARKTVKRTTPRSSGNETYLFRRIVIISACLVLFVIGVVSINRHSVTQAVAGAQIMNGLFNQATVSLPPVPNAASYNIYYRQTGEQTFTNAVRNIPLSVHNYTISDLKKGVNYEYQISAVNSDGKEIYFSDIKPITDLQSM